LSPTCTRYKQSEEPALAAVDAIHGTQILDSRGNPTFEVEVALDDGSVGRAVHEVTRSLLAPTRAARAEDARG